MEEPAGEKQKPKPSWWEASKASNRGTTTTKANVQTNACDPTDYKKELSPRGYLETLEEASQLNKSRR